MLNCSPYLITFSVGFRLKPKVCVLLSSREYYVTQKEPESSRSWWMFRCFEIGSSEFAQLLWDVISPFKHLQQQLQLPFISGAKQKMWDIKNANDLGRAKFFIVQHRNICCATLWGWSLPKVSVAFRILKVLLKNEKVSIHQSLGTFWLFATSLVRHNFIFITYFWPLHFQRVALGILWEHVKI